ncbi:metabolite traffic protein EboE [Flavobacteriaceae bacterium XHP0103]|uniref:metabolite traffic protein EboE n=1 Tax=Marixanthotalea marina TaxID=2844359 RepID=UPI002989D778|nr:metabolite traffic protein EboE [Marixanthotalea marina]MBU3823091.1 metabolite traffic protein EboE [Marixanthotalea marina]
MQINNDYHITYCTNIHPGKNWVETFENLKKFVPQIKKEVSGDRPFGLGLRLSNKASEELGFGDNLHEFQNWLLANNCYVFTMNGFPYGSFHNSVVKDQVHTPDWTTKERLDYTKRLFEQLKLLLPKDMDGGISTSPISYKHWFNSEKAIDEAFQTGAAHLSEIAEQLYEIEQKSGKYLHLDIEPEPDGLIENTQEFVDFYLNYLIPIGKKHLVSKIGVSENEAESIIKRHITLCYDVCHFSLAFETPKYTFEALDEIGVSVGKIQVSAALKVLFENGNEDKVWESLERFNEPTYLHQVTEKINGDVKVYNDLPIVLEQRKKHKELRAHFHVPIFLEAFDYLHSTQDQIIETIKYIKNKPISSHLEVETYTWDVLPNSLKLDLAQSITRELKWLKDNLE